MSAYAGERRVLLTLSCAACEPAALANAVRLAESLGARLMVRFVEDEGLLHWAALPFTREVVLASARPRALDVAAMERALRAAAEAARARLERLVRDAARLSFEIRRGTPAAELLAALGEADVAIGYLADHGREGWVAVLRAQPQAEDLAAALLELAGRSGWPLEIVIVGDEPAAPPASPPAAARARLRRLADERALAALLRAGARAYDEDSKRGKHDG